MPIKVSIAPQTTSNEEFSAFLRKHNTLFSDGAAEVVVDLGNDQKGLPAVSQADVYQEMMQSVRYYGTVRYVLFPLYLTVTAVLVSQFYGGKFGIPAWTIIIAGLLSSFFWLVFEYSLSESMRTTWDEIGKIVAPGTVFPFAKGEEQLEQKKREKTVNPLSHRRDRITLAARFAFYVIYGIGFAYWGYVGHLHWQAGQAIVVDDGNAVGGR